jgi:hypothetical protein
MNFCTICGKKASFLGGHEYGKPMVAIFSKQVYLSIQ